MKKKTAFTFGSIVLVATVLSVGVIYLSGANAPVVDELPIPDTTVSRQEESSTAYSVPPISVEAKEVVKEPEVEKVGDSIPPPEVAETTEPDGTDVQTPNWEAQKELEPDTDLENPDKKPEYVKSPSSSSVPSASSKTGSTPKNGDTKVVDGQSYTYLKPFGWVKDGSGGTTEYIDLELSGEKVGH